MNHKEAFELKNFAYSLYPEGMWDGDPKYFLSPQHIRLQEVQALKMKPAMKKWKVLVQDLLDSSDSLNFELENWERGLIIDQCYKLKIIATNTAQLRQDRVRLVLNLSFLIPYFVIHQSRETPDSRRNGDLIFETGSFIIPDIVKPIHSFLLDKLKIHFPGYKEFDMEIGAIPLDNIMFDGRGYVPPFSSPDTKRINIYNAFFTCISL